MDVIFAKIILNEDDKTITKRDLINDGFDCEIFVNEIRFINNIKLKKDNHIIYIFKNKYKSIKEMFKGCSLLTSINLSNYKTSHVSNMNSMFENCSSLEWFPNIGHWKGTDHKFEKNHMFFGCKIIRLDIPTFFGTNI